MRLLVRGVNGVIDSRGGGIVSPVVSEPKDRVVASECTSVRCVRQLETMRADVLQPRSAIRPQRGRAKHRDGDARSKDFCLFVHVKRGEPVREQLPRLQGPVAPAEVPELDFAIRAARSK